MTLSIIIPLYNAQGTISECIQSIRTYVNTEYEIIVVDNASTDASKELCFHLSAEQASAKALRVEWIELDKNYGAAYARNRGAKEATGDMLLFIDADVEIISPHTIPSLCAAVTNAHVPTVVCAGYAPECAHDNVWSWYKHMYQCYLQEHAPQSMPNCTAATMAMRRDTFLSGVLFNAHLPSSDLEDFNFFLDIINRGGGVVLQREHPVRHIRRYETREFISMEFRRSRNFVYVWLCNVVKPKAVKPTQRCGFVSLNYRMSFFLMPFLLLSILLIPFNATLCIVLHLIFAVVNVHFLQYIKEKRTLSNALIALGIIWFDLCICVLGALNGIGLFLVARNKNE